MKQKLTSAALWTLLAAVGGMGLYIAEPKILPLPDPSEVVINAPATCAIGELVRLDTDGSLANAFAWKVIPATTNFEVIDEGRAAVFSEGAGGTYTFIVSGVHEDTVCIAAHTITVGGSAPDVPGLDDKIWDWLDLIPSTTKKEDASRLGDNFRKVAEKIRDTMLPEEIIRLTQESTRKALGDEMDEWEPFLQRLREELNERAQQGELETPGDHQRLWRRIGDALKNYARK